MEDNIRLQLLMELWMESLDRVNLIESSKDTLEPEEYERLIHNAHVVGMYIENVYKRESQR